MCNVPRVRLTRKVGKDTNSEKVRSRVNLRYDTLQMKKHVMFSSPRVKNLSYFFLINKGCKAHWRANEIHLRQ